MIKTCAQDGPHVERLVRHIVGQLGSETRFTERFVAVDPRPDGFVRQFGPTAVRQLDAALDRLLCDGVIDDIYRGPTERSEVARVNRDWFACGSSETHCVRGIPVVPQLAGFERARGEYVLQVDIDAMIRRRDVGHDFLSDMLFALDGDERNVSASFNAAHGSIDYVRYDAPPGGWVPDVRFSLIDRRKLLALRPLPNGVTASGALALTWYRSLERKQREFGVRSVRGGDRRTFFIHPPNSLKREPSQWMDILDRVESGRLPAAQFGSQDLVEDNAAWAAADRDPYSYQVKPPEELLAEIKQRHPDERIILVVRHGEKAAARDASWSAVQAAGLSDAGARAVAEFGRKLAAGPRVILSSPLPRCHETASILCSATGGTAEIVALDELLGGRFGDHARWMAMKRKLGWSALVARWIEGDVDRAVVTPYAEWLPACLVSVRPYLSAAGLTLIVSQGYLTTALAHHLTGRIEMRGGALHGFVWPSQAI
jgi:broad specificity phosphatase PhoE